MVYIEAEDKLKHVYRRDCCKKLPEDPRLQEKLIGQRKKYITPEHTETIYSSRRRAVENLDSTKEKLRKKRIEADKKTQQLVEQWRELIDGEKELQNDFKTFNKFVGKNREKLEREKARYVHFHQQRRQRQLEIIKISGEIEEYVVTKNRMHQEIDKHSLYEDFLMKFKETFKMKSVEEVLDRYFTLCEAEERLNEDLQNNYTRGLKYTSKYNDAIRRWNVDTNKLLETLTLRMKRYEEVKFHVIQWECVVNKIVGHVQDTWANIQMTRDAMDHIVCLLLIRLKAKSSPEVMRKRKTFQHLLSTQEGKILYINKMYGDLRKVRKELEEFLQENKTGLDESRRDQQRSSTKFQVMPRISIIKKTVYTETQQETPQQIQKTYDKFPEITPGTAKILEKLKQKEQSGWDRIRAKVKNKNTSEISSVRSHEVDSNLSNDTKVRMFPHWQYMIDMKKTEGSREGTEDSRRETDTGFNRTSDYFTDKQYSCIAVTTDQLGKLLGDKKSKLHDCIIERNFDRYEKVLKDPLKETDSSILKINKLTGRLELPKLMRKKTNAPSFINEFNYQEWANKKIKLNAYLPSLSESSSRAERIKKRHYISRTQTDAKKNLEDIEKFLSRPTIHHAFNIDNLN